MDQMSHTHIQEFWLNCIEDDKAEVQETTEWSSLLYIKKSKVMDVMLKFVSSREVLYMWSF